MLPSLCLLLAGHVVMAQATSFSDMYDTSDLKPGLNDSVLCYAKVHGVTKFTAENSRWIGIETSEDVAHPVIVHHDCAVEPLSQAEFDSIASSMLTGAYSPHHDYCADLHAQLLQWADDRAALGRERIYPIPLNVGPVEGKIIAADKSPQKPFSAWMTWLPLLFTVSFLYWRNLRRKKLVEKIERERKEEEERAQHKSAAAEDLDKKSL